MVHQRKSGGVHAGTETYPQQEQRGAGVRGPRKERAPVGRHRVALGEAAEPEELRRVRIERRRARARAPGSPAGRRVVRVGRGTRPGPSVTRARRPAGLRSTSSRSASIGRLSTRTGKCRSRAEARRPSPPLGRNRQPPPRARGLRNRNVGAHREPVPTQEVSLRRPARVCRREWSEGGPGSPTRVRVRGFLCTVAWRSQCS